MALSRDDFKKIRDILESENAWTKEDEKLIRSMLTDVESRISIRKYPIYIEDGKKLSKLCTEIKVSEKMKLLIIVRYAISVHLQEINKEIEGKTKEELYNTPGITEALIAASEQKKVLEIIEKHYKRVVNKTDKAYKKINKRQ